MIYSSCALLSHTGFFHQSLNGVLRLILYIIINDELLRGFGISVIVIISSTLFRL